MPVIVKRAKDVKKLKRRDRKARSYRSFLRWKIKEEIDRPLIAVLNLSSEQSLNVSKIWSDVFKENRTSNPTPVLDLVSLFPTT